MNSNLTNSDYFIWENKLMSKENEKTVSVYKHYAAKYMENTLKKNDEEPEDTKIKELKLQRFLKESFSTLSRDSVIFEIGSGAGENATYLLDIGYNIVASDVAEDFLLAEKDKKLNAIKFNALEDSFQQKYAGVLCWRVFVHFTKEDAEVVLRKVFEALEDKGRFVFNVMNRQVHDVDSEWLDFKGTYNLGSERFYQYFDENELTFLIKQIGYKIVKVNHEGGSNKNKWIVYVLEK